MFSSLCRLWAWTLLDCTSTLFPFGSNLHLGGYFNKKEPVAAFCHVVHASERVAIWEKQLAVLPHRHPWTEPSVLLILLLFYESRHLKKKFTSS